MSCVKESLDISAAGEIESVERKSPSSATVKENKRGQLPFVPAKEKFIFFVFLVGEESLLCNSEILVHQGFGFLVVSSLLFVFHLC
jgi:hypothetical protein